MKSAVSFHAGGRLAKFISDPAVYFLAPPFQKVKPHPYLVTDCLFAASFVSLQSALADYGMISRVHVNDHQRHSWSTIALGDAIGNL